jgi:hypothetical protein
MTRETRYLSRSEQGVMHKALLKSSRLLFSPFKKGSQLTCVHGRYHLSCPRCRVEKIYR